MVSGIMGYIGKALIIALSVWVTLLMVEGMYPEVGQPIVPAVFVGIIAYYSSCLFLSIYDYASLTILHCFIVDLDLGGSQSTPDCLKDFIEMNDREHTSKTEV